MEEKTNWFANILYLLAWLVCSLLIIVDFLAVREATLDIMTAFRVKQVEASAVGEKVATQISTGFTMRAIDTTFMVISGVVAVVLAIAIEYYFRTGKQKGKLLRKGA